MLDDWQWLCLLIGSVAIMVPAGHLIWILIAKLFGSSKPPEPSAPALQSVDIFRTQGQLNRLLHARLIDPETYHRVSAALQQLRQGPVPPPLPVIPLAPPPQVAVAPPPSLAQSGNQVDTAQVPEPAVPPPLPSVSAAPAPTALIGPETPAVPPVLPHAQTPQVAPRTPTRPPSESFAAFLRTSNIRWGELIGGLLIIGCSIALVVSFWNQIAGKPFFQFAIFTGVTTAMLSLGLYAEHRWKLPTTSRGILLIGTLLVPLNFLGFAALSHGQSAGGISMFFEIASLALFGYLVFVAARTLAAFWPILFTIGVIGSSASLLIARHVGPAGALPVRLAVAALPILTCALPVGVMLRRASRWTQVRARLGDAILMLLGVLAFGAALSLGYVVFQGDEPWKAAHDLAPLLSFAAAPSLAVGLLLWRKATAKSAARVRTIGTAIAIASAFLMLGAVALAWPDPASMLPLAAVDFIVLAAIAVLFELPAAHVLDSPFLLLAWLLGFQLVRGQIGWHATPDALLQALLDPANGPALLPLSALIGASAHFMRRTRPTDARIDGWVAAAFSLIGVALVSQDFARSGDPHGATWVYLVESLAAIAAVRWLRRPAVAWAACVLLLAAFIQFFITRTSVAFAPQTALIAYATIATLGRLLLRRIRGRFDALRDPAQWAATGVSAAAVVTMLAFLSCSVADAIGWRLAWICAIWLVLAVDEGVPGLFYAGQFLLALATSLGVIGKLAGREWFRSAAEPLMEPWTLQAIGLGLAVLSVVYFVAEVVLPKTLIVRDWLARQWSVARLLSLLLVVGLAVIIAAGTVSSFGIEFSTSTARPLLETWAAHSCGAAAWALWGILLLIFAARTWRRDRIGLLVLLIVASLACPLISAHFADAGASASALRWSLAAFLFVATTALLVQRLLSTRLSAEIRVLLAALCAAPILALSVYPALMTLAGWNLAGPVPGSFFARVGNSASYVLPLLIVAAAFCANAIHERSPGWAAAASLVCNLTVTLGYALAVVTAHQPFDDLHVDRLVQLNVLALAAFAIAWQALRVWDRRASASIGARAMGRPPIPLYVQVGIALAGNLLLILPALLRLFADPGTGSDLIQVVGGGLGWSCLLLSHAAFIWIAGIRRQTISTVWFGPAALSFAVMIAFTAGFWNQANWLSYHTLMITTVLAMALVPAARLWREKYGIAIPAGSAPRTDSSPVEAMVRNADPAQTSPKLAVLAYAHPGPPRLPLLKNSLRPILIVWSALLSMAVLILALRAIGSDPQSPWWTVGSLATLSLIWTGLAASLNRPGLLLAAPSLNLAATIWYAKTISGKTLPDFLSLNVAVLAVFGLAAFILHFNVFASLPPAGLRRRLPFHRAASLLCALCVVLLAASGLWSNFFDATTFNSPLLTWAAIAGALALATTILWDPEAPLTTPQLFGLGLAALVTLLNPIHLAGESLRIAVSLVLPGYVLLTGVLCGLRHEIADVIERIGLPRPARRESAAWLLPTDFVLALFAIALSTACDLQLSHLAARVGIAAATLAQAAGLAMATRRDRRPGIHLMPLSTVPLAAVTLAWAFMSPENANWLDRSVVAMSALAVCTIAYVAAVNRFIAPASPWSSAARRILSPLAIATGACLLLILILEIEQRSTTGAVSMLPWGIVVVLVTLIAGAALAIHVALHPLRDPLQLAERHREGYVYGSEALAALAFLHLRLTAPWLFGGLLSHYWPLIMMALAFGGVGLGEVFARRKTHVLANPLQRTGIFLPLLPIIAMWLAPSRVDPSVLLFTAGVFYAIVSAARKSFLFGVAAALAANGGLWWIFYHRPGLGFLTHPQIWLVPVAVSVLVAAQLNRDRLPAIQLRFIRYCCLMLAYVSSTSDIFLNGVADHPWLPMVLAVLSIAGVMLGIFLRLRAFLFLGTAFLALAIVTMIYYASTDLHWTWLWYVAGILLGGGIIALFALFEKRRGEMIAMVEGLRKWE